MAAGKNHTCAILAIGSVKCWGNNEHGQLGNGNTIASNIPVDVIGVTNAAAITTGWGHTCALTNSGGVKCWGYNRNGELGDGTNQDSNIPVDVVGLSAAAVDLDAGDDHTCVVTGSGQVQCWGYNEYGQLGDGTEVSRSVPVEAQGFGEGIKRVAAGWGHTCVLNGGGGVECRGNNQLGQLGYGQESEYRLTGVDVLGLGVGVMEITADGGSTCALAAGGGVKCWGGNKYGQLGDGTAKDRGSPVAVIGLSRGVVRVAAGWNHTCAVTGNGDLECWGWNYYGQLGDGSKTSGITPVRAVGLTDGVADIGMGWGHTCVVTDLGGVRCWGLNENGQLGDGTTIDSLVPMKVFGINSLLAPNRTNTPTVTLTDTPTPTNMPTLSPTNLPQNTPTNTLPPGPVVEAIAISASDGNTCALTRGGGVKCWGFNEFGQLGDGTLTDRLSPVDVVGLAGGMTAVSAGGFHTCAVTRKGGVKCWGNNEHGELGDGTTINRAAPVNVSGLSNDIVALDAGSSHTCALDISGGVRCWGGNWGGQLGNGTRKDSLAPVEVSGLSSGVIAITAGASHTCALTMAGKVMCWGDNSFGQLGDGTLDLHTTPVDVVGLSTGVAAIASNIYHTCALTFGGGLKCWGSNRSGQLGDGSKADASEPVDVRGLSTGVTGVTTGYGHTCAQIVSGAVKCWGYNQNGELGNGSTTDSSVPVEVEDLSSDVVAIAAADNHTCVLTAAGRVKCWGYNEDGELGNGKTKSSSTPVDVIGFGGLPGTATPAAGTPFVPTKTKTSTPP